MANLLFLCDTYPPNVGGSEAVMENLARGCVAKGHSVVLLTPASNAPHETETRYDRAEPYIIQRSRAWRRLFHWGGSRVPVLNRCARLLMVLLVFRMALRLRDADAIVVGHILPLGWIASAIKRMRGTRIITVTYGEDVSVYRNGPRTRPMLEAALAASDAVTSLTAITARQIAELAPPCAGRLTVIPPPVNPEIAAIPAAEGAALRGKHGMLDRRVLLTVARMVPRKGVDVTMEALALLAPEYPDLIYLVIGTGPDLPRLQTLRTRLDLADRVQFLGEVEDQRPFFHACDVFVMPNRTMPDGEQEGYGIVFAEAGLAGRPVIAGRSGGAVEAVEDGVTGFVVDPGDPRAVAGAIRRLLDDPAVSARMGGAGLRHAMEKCAPPVIWDAFDTVVRRVVNGD